MSRSLIAAFCVVAGLASIDAAAAQPVSVTDSRGQELSLKAPAERVVTIPIPAASIIMAISGKPDAVVGMHPASMAGIKGTILEKIYPSALDIPANITRGGQFAPNVETILSLRPDFVVQWASMGDEIIAPLVNAGLPVLGVRYGTQADSEAIFAMLGTALGRPGKAETIIAGQRDTQKAIAARVAGLPEEQRPKVLYMLRFADSLRPTGAGSYNDFYIKLTGGRQAANGISGTTTDVNAEQILAWNPDIILLGNFDPGLPADVYKNPLFATLNAVRNKRVYRMPHGGYRWDPPSQESALTWMWLAEVTHPGLFDFDLPAETRRFYKSTYGYDLSDADVRGILQADANAGAAGYDQLLAGR